MQYADLGGNRLYGTLPPGLGSLSSLKGLRLRENSGITGSLPLQWSALTALEQLDLASCNVTGTLPGVYKYMGALRELNLGNNSLTVRVRVAARMHTASVLTTSLLPC